MTPMNQIRRYCTSRDRAKLVYSKLDILFDRTNHSIMKKYIVILLSLLTINCIYAQDFFYTVGQDAIDQNQSTPEIGAVAGEDITANDSLLVKLLAIFGLDGFITGSTNGATNYISYIINIAL